MIELAKNFEIKLILKVIKKETTYYCYRDILLNIGYELLEIQKENIKNFKKDPKKYRRVIKKIDNLLNTIEKELGVNNYE